MTAARTTRFNRPVLTRCSACLKTDCARLISFREFRPVWAVTNATGANLSIPNVEIRYSDYLAIVISASSASSHLLTTSTQGV